MINKTLYDDSKQFSKWRQRIGYGVSDLACNLIWQMISLYLLFFYTDIMELNPMSVSLMFMLTRILDGITDLIVGYMIDRTHTRWGKSRPYFLFGAIPFALFAVLCFSVPNISSTGKVIYAYITYFGLSVSYTIVNVPMASILPSLTNDTKERTALTTSRKFFGFLGATIVSSSAMYLINLFGGNNSAKGFQLVMLLFGIVSSVLLFFTFFNVRETVSTVRSDISLKKVFYSLKNNQPWLIFALNILFMWTGYFLQTGALIYYFSSVIGNSQLSTLVATIMSIVPMISNFFVPFLASKLGKRNLFVTFSIVQCIGILIIMIAGTNVTIILVGAGVSAIGYGIKESIYFSMQADPVDYGVWKTGVNVSGSLSAINGFLGKIAQAIAGGVAGALLSYGNYQSNSLIQSTEAIFVIQSMYLYIPMILILCSVVTMMFYKLDSLLSKIELELEESQTE